MKTIDYKKYDGHTPGPWSPANTNKPSNMMAGDGTFFADLRFWNRGTLAVDANRTLVADAPLLLEACRERDAVLETLEISYRARIRELEESLKDLQSEYDHVSNQLDALGD